MILLTFFHILLHLSKLYSIPLYFYMFGPIGMEIYQRHCVGCDETVSCKPDRENEALCGL